MVIRVIYLEVVFLLFIDFFIMCFRWFIVRRGKLIVIYFDNGINFVGVNCELCECINDWN